jgi:hypothetical protein
VFIVWVWANLPQSLRFTHNTLQYIHGLLLYLYADKTATHREISNFMPSHYYHGTTVEGYNAIMRDGYIRPQSGNTYQNKIFLAGNDKYARRVTFIKHAKQQGETIVVFKIPKYLLKKKYISDGSKHISYNLSFGDKTYCYSQPIEITDDILVGSAPFTLNLPEGVDIVRVGKSTGISFTKEAAEQFLI